jgi:hypothetical protein
MTIASSPTGTKTVGSNSIQMSTIQLDSNVTIVTERELDINSNTSFITASIDSFESSDTRIIRYTVVDTTGVDECETPPAVDITGAGIVSDMYNPINETVVASSNDDDITIHKTDTSNGVFEIHIGESATAGIEGRYRLRTTIEELDTDTTKTSFKTHIKIDSQLSAGR